MKGLRQVEKCTLTQNNSLNIAHGQEQARYFQETMREPTTVLDCLEKEEGVNLEEQLTQSIEYGFVPPDIKNPHWKVMSKIVSKGK